MVKKQTLLKIIELVQELDKTVKPIECSMIINDMEKVIERHTLEQLNLHNVSNRRELLIAFKEHLSELTMDLDSYTDKDLLDGFESNL